MVYGILAALAEELAPLLRETQVERETELYGTKLVCGTLRGVKVALCQCGIATVNAALCANAVIREGGAGLVINTGIAGALGEGVRTLDVVISSDVVYHDRDQTLLQKYYPFTNAFKADESLVRRACDAARGVSVRDIPVRVHVGRVATGDLFISDRAVKADILARVNPLCVEMEGAAIANTAYANGVPFVVIRTMSDNADEAADESYDSLIVDASTISASIVLKLLEGEH